MVEITNRRQIGQAVFLLGMLAWGFGISYAETGADTAAYALFAGGTVVMGAGLYVIRHESIPNDEG